MTLIWQKKTPYRLCKRYGVFFFDLFGYFPLSVRSSQMQAMFNAG